MFKLIKILYIYFIFFNSILFAKDLNKFDNLKLSSSIDDNEVSNESKKLKDFENIINFGISSKRVWLINNIVKEKNQKYYNFFDKMLEAEKNEKVYVSLIKAIDKLKLKKHKLKIIEKASSKNLNIQIASIKTLGNLKIKESEGILLKILKKPNNNKWITINTIESLGKLKSQKSISVMYKLYNNFQEEDIKLEILKSIGKIGNIDSVPFLERKLKEKSNSNLVKSQAAKSLAMIGDKQSLEILKSQLKNSEQYVLNTIIEALPIKNNHQTFINLLRNDNEEIRFQALKSILKDPREKLFKILKYIFYNDSSEKVKYKAIEALQLIDNKEVMKILKKELKKENLKIKEIILKNLKNMKDKKKCYEILKQSIKNTKNPKLLKLIIKQSFEIESKNKTKAVNLIEEKIFSLKDNSYLSIKLNAISLIVKNLKENSIKSLKKYIKNKNIHIKRYAYYYLINLNIKKSLKCVKENLKSEKNPSIINYVLNLISKRKIKYFKEIIKNFFIKHKIISIKNKALETIKILKQA